MTTQTKPVSPELQPTKEIKVRKPMGFAAMDCERVREIARKGGIAAHAAGTAHEFTKEEARIAGRKGGKASGERKAERAASK